MWKHVTTTTSLLSEWISTAEDHIVPLVLTTCHECSDFCCWKSPPTVLLSLMNSQAQNSVGHACMHANSCVFSLLKVEKSFSVCEMWLPIDFVYVDGFKLCLILLFKMNPLFTVLVLIIALTTTQTPLTVHPKFVIFVKSPSFGVFSIKVWLKK